MSGLVDFGQGALQGGMSGASTGNPWVIGGLALGGGLLNYFAGSEEEKERQQFNRLNMQLGQQQLASGAQQLGLGRLAITEQKRRQRQEKLKQQKLDTFREMFSRSITGGF